MSESNTQSSIASQFDIVLDVCDIAKMQERLPAVETQRLSFKSAVDAALGPFVDYKDFCARALTTTEEEALIYSVKGHNSKIVVPVKYANHLAEVRKLRLAMKDGEAEAEKALNDHAYGKRVLPEDIVQCLDVLPNTNLISRVMLLDTANPDDRWVKEKYSPTFVSSAAFEPSGDILLFSRNNDEFLMGDITHEWVHALRNQSKYQKYVGLLDTCIELERGYYLPVFYMLRSHEEHTAVLGERLLSLEGQKFFDMADGAPLRTFLWFEMLKAELEDAGHPQSICLEHFQKRIKYVADLVKDKGSAFLVEKQNNITKVLEYFLRPNA